MPLVSIYLKKYKSTHKGDTCTLMFIIAVFTIAKIWDQPRCSTTNEWIKKIWSIYSVE
jgi:hypothetical protein